MEEIELSKISHYVNKINNIEEDLLREEVMDRILDIALMIKKLKINMIVDYIKLISDLKTNFTIDKAYTIIEDMENDKQIQMYTLIHNQIKKYNVEILQLYIK